MTATLTSIAILLAGLALWGVGRNILRNCGVAAHVDVLAIGVGLAATIAVGGILNALQLAYAPALWSLMGIGGVVAVLELRRSRFRPGSLRTMPGPAIAAMLVIAAAALFTIVTQVPPRGLNHFDDLEKYFAHPVRMLATGTLSGSPLNSLGLSTLGGQAFLQGFVASLLPIQHINEVDAVFGLAILLGIGAVIGWRLAPGSFAVVAIPLAVMLIEPQYVNASGSYLPCVLMLSAFLLVAGNSSPGKAGPPFLLGVLYAGLVSLKLTFPLFAVVHFSLALLAVALAFRAGRALARWVLWVALGASAGILPWLVTYRQEYARWGQNSTAETLTGAGPLPDLLSTGTLFLGGSYAAYSAVAAVCALAAALCLRGPRSPIPSVQGLNLGLVAAAATGPVCYLLVFALVGPLSLGYESALRYTIPILTAATVPALGALYAAAGKWPRGMSVALSAAVLLVFGQAFGSSALARFSQAWNYGSILAFPIARQPEFLDYIDYALSDRARDRVRRFQAQVPPTEPLLAWISTPYFLDYSRNTIFDAVPAGLIAPWAQVPANIHYVLWQYKGFAVRQPGNYEAAMGSPDLLIQIDAKKGYGLAKRLFQLWIWADSGSDARIVARDDEFVLFAITRMPE